MSFQCKNRLESLEWKVDSDWSAGIIVASPNPDLIFLSQIWEKDCVTWRSTNAPARWLPSLAIPSRKPAAAAEGDPVGGPAANCVPPEAQVGQEQVLVTSQCNVKIGENYFKWNLKLEKVRIGRNFRMHLCNFPKKTNHSKKECNCVKAIQLWGYSGYIARFLRKSHSYLAYPKTTCTFQGPKHKKAYFRLENGRRWVGVQVI